MGGPLHIDPSITQPSTILTMTTSTGETAIVIDWTGTGFWYDTQTHGGWYNSTAYVTFKPAQQGLPTVSPAAIWVSNVNDPDLDLRSYGGVAVSIPQDLTQEVTKADPHAVLVGSMDVRVAPPQGYDTVSSGISVTDNQGKESQAATNVLTRSLGPDHQVNLDLVNNSTDALTNARILFDLPSDFSLELTGPGEIQDQNGLTVPVKEAQILYFMLRSGGTPDLTQYVPESEVNDWSSVRSVIVEVPNLSGISEYRTVLHVTDDHADEEVKRWVTLTSTMTADDIPRMTQSARDSYVVFKGAKSWDDANDILGARPASIDVELVDPSGKVVQTVTADQWGAWQYDFNAPPVDDRGNFIEYTVREASVPEGYESHVDGLDLTNTSTHLMKSLPVTGGEGVGLPPLAVAVFGAGVVVALIAARDRARARG